MNSAGSAGLVRRWVALYTRGLAAGVRDARRDEIESDLWDQCQEALEIGRPDGAVAGEILARLVLGIAADVSWRLEQAGARRHRRVERRITMGTRIVGLLAVLGGLALVISVGVYAPARQARPDVAPWQVITDPTLYAVWAVLGITAMVAMSVATIGLAYLLIDRIDPGAVLVAVLAGIGGILGVMGAYSALLLLPVGSAILMLYLARARLMNAWIAVGHALAAAAWVVPLGASLAGRSDERTLVAAVLYAMSWVLIGASVLRGLPTPQPTTSAPDGKLSAGGIDATT